MKTVDTPDYILENYADVRPVCLIEGGPFDGQYAHLAPMLYTVGIMVSNPGGWTCRWCYESALEALRALEAWDGQGDPSGPWIKYKGVGGERHGPASTVPEEDR